MVRRIYRHRCIFFEGLPIDRKCVKCGKPMELYVNARGWLGGGILPTCTECYHKFLNGDLFY